MIIIDTHILLWWKLNDDSLKTQYRDLLEQNQSEIIGVSAVSLMEIICLYDRERINLPESPERWIAGLMSESRIAVISISAKIAIDALDFQAIFTKIQLIELSLPQLEFMIVQFLVKMSR